MNDKLITLKNGNTMTYEQLKLNKQRYYSIMFEKIIIKELCDKYNIKPNEIKKENLEKDFYNKFNEIISFYNIKYKEIPSLNALRYGKNKSSSLFLDK